MRRCAPSWLLGLGVLVDEAGADSFQGISIFLPHVPPDMHQSAWGCVAWGTIPILEQTPLLSSRAFPLFVTGCPQSRIFP